MKDFVKGFLYFSCYIQIGIALNDCSKTKYGCCTDGITPAMNENHSNCPRVDVFSFNNCEYTEFGCCFDGVTPANGRLYEGCIDNACQFTMFGCCDDLVTATRNESKLDCPKHCAASPYGCCPDGKTASRGHGFAGCPNMSSKKSSSNKRNSCSKSKFGCCPFDTVAAKGPNGYGCVDRSCEQAEFGCCDDMVTVAYDRNRRTCPSYCDHSDYRCCPDGKTAARGPGFAGCPDVQFTLYETDIQNFYLKSQDDVRTTAQTTTAALIMITMVTDETTEIIEVDDELPIEKPKIVQLQEISDEREEGGDVVATEDNQDTGEEAQPEGENTEGEDTGGTTDEQQQPEEAAATTTAMIDPSESTLPPEPVACEVSQFECCPDGVSVALGPKFDGCREDETYLSYSFTFIQEDVCVLPQDTGSCTNYTRKWRYDPLSGRCSELLYGGCGGNGNRFETEDDCKTRCVSPPGNAFCKLSPINPTITNCTEEAIRYYFDPNSNLCKPFKYSGCYGNRNNFVTLSDCESSCKLKIITEHCSMLPEKGPCRGTHERWYYDAKSGICRTFTYGGCLKNKNNFKSEEDCIGLCVKVKQNDFCLLPTIIGNCEGAEEKWSYDFKEGACKPFAYSGCNGNLNRFDTQEACSYTCQGMKTYELEAPTEICQLPKVLGNCVSKLKRYFYNQTVNMCQEFFYSGCDGNANNFETELTCRSTCNADEADPCVMPMSVGPCEDYSLNYFFDMDRKRCEPFYYGGCNGNANRFATKKDCEINCKITKEERELFESIPQRCFSPTDIGTYCDNPAPRFFYDIKTQACSTFDYTGCGPEDANRFEEEGECAAVCGNAAFIPNIDGLTQPEVDDTCEQSVRIGRCKSRVVRWFYDKKTKYCKTFEYSGCDGNKNNFPTRHSCVNFCEKKMKKEICLSQKIPGPCLYFQRRWYFDTDTLTCLPFTYGGCLGNENNFMSQYECKNFCWDFVNDTSKSIDENALVIGPVMASIDNATQDMCSLPLMVGSCNMKLNRWYFDTATRTCQPFKYGGCFGNQNNFENREICEDKCGHSVVHISDTIIFGSQTICEFNIELESNCTVNETNADLIGNMTNIEWYFDLDTRTCKIAFLDCIPLDIPNRFQSFNDCLSQCVSNTTQPEVTQDDCLLPVNSGREQCTSQTWRWYYDRHTGDCALFTYRGCGGNNNNFQSRVECLHLCATVGGMSCPQLGVCDIFCEYGYGRTLNGCEVCQCNDPCKNFNCTIDEECGVENLTAVCRLKIKPGYCPENVTIADRLCRRQCDNDAKCAYDQKCCSTHCTGTKCVAPTFIVAPSIDEFSDFVELLEGADAVLPCTVSGNPFPTVTWFKNRVEMVFDVNDTRISVNGTTNALYVNNVTHEDEGIYACRASSNVTKIAMKEGKLIVNVPTSLSHKSYEKFGLLGTNAVLYCNATGVPRPKVHWRSESKGDIRFNSTKLAVYEFAIEVKNIEYSDLGKYYCYAKNGFGRTITTIVTLSRGMPAELRFTRQMMYADLESTVHAYCDHVGIPQANVTWISNRNEDITRTNNTKKYKIYPNGTLEIRRIELDDDGLYKCSVANEFTSDFMRKRLGNIYLNVQYPPSVNDKAETIIINQSNDVTLNCSTVGKPKPSISWFKNDKLVINDETTRKIYKYFFNKTTGALTILNLKPTDTGTYVCVAKNLDKYLTANLSISLIVPKVIHRESSTVYINETDNMLFDCYVTDIKVLINATWVKDAEDFQPLDSRYSYPNNHTQLRINSLQLSDAGVYKCTVENDTSIYINEIKLIIQSKDVYYESRHTVMGVARTRSTELDCVWWFADNPLYLTNTTAGYKIKWLVDGQLIDQASSYALEKYEFLDQNKILKIKNLRLTDPVSYTCFFYLSKFFVKISNFTLDIGSMPALADGSTVKNGSYIWHQRFDTVILKCPLVSRPEPDISWYFNRSLIKPFSNEIFEIEPYDGALRIVELDEAIQGLYHCNATNPYGYNILEYFVELFAPMLIIKKPNTIVAKRQRTIQLECAYTGGKPKPATTWYFQGKAIKPVNEDKHQLYDNILVINDVQRQDAGTYMCVLTNGYHQAQQYEYTVSVYDPLEIKFFPTDLVFLIGKNAQIKCLASGIPKAQSISWYRSGKLLSEGNSKRYLVNGNQLTIFRVTLDDSGAYVCRASNTFTNVTAIANVKIKGPQNDIDCDDSSSYLNCKIIVAKKLCKKFGQYCCKTCRSAGYAVGFTNERDFSIFTKNTS